jgi:pimeloyl-ACP methyl ester carboxylesterase
MAYALIVGAARLLHRRVLYQPPDEAAADVPEGAALLTAKAADGVSVNALEFVAPKATRTIVHFHGNAETAEANAFLAREMKKRGFSVVLVEYRGYGRSRGTSPTEEGLYLDAAAILDVLAARGIGPDQVVLWGQSLGTGVAAEMANRGRGARLALVAPFTSTVAMASRVMPFLPASLVMIDRFDTLSKAPSIAAPTLVVHGDIDDVIPFEQGETVSRALAHGTFLKVPEGRHDNLYKSMSVITALAAHAGG